ncbi:hypothetical protein [Lacrimispora xylanisolvens]|uniref:hypothetical protein n=1 Tax=Lacrimispora xylanisolvens TaxID=384636 RepID=UPI002402CE6D
MNLYQMIFKRRSIKKYKKEPVPEQLKKGYSLFWGLCFKVIRRYSGEDGDL